MRTTRAALILCASLAWACDGSDGEEDAGASNDAARIDGGSRTDGGGEDPCSGALTLCDGACVDLESNLAHCGACMNECEDDETCTERACALDCESRGLTACTGRCVNTQTDPGNCGDCGVACDEGEVCDRGGCAIECSGGLVACGASCVDLSSDPQYCGDCDLACTAPDRAEPVCSRGECAWQCREGFDDCDGSESNGCEADLSTPATCGTCETTCEDGPGASAICDTGECGLACATDRIDCDGDVENGCEIDAAELGVLSIEPSDGETLLDRAPVIVVTFRSAIDPTAGTVRLAGDMGTDASFDLATAPPEITFSEGNTRMQIEAARTFPWGETLSLSFRGIGDARCEGGRGDLASPAWSIRINPCEPGLAGMIGVARTEILPEAAGAPTEVYLAVDERADGYVYIGGIAELARIPKAGGALETGLFATTGITALAPVRPGYKMLFHGDDVFWLSRDRGTDGMLFRLSDDGGESWAPIDYATFDTAPNDDFRGIAIYQDAFYLLTHEDTPGVATQIYTAPVSGTAPVAGALAQSFEAGESFCGGLAVDDEYFYVTCAGLEHLLRVDRSSGAVDVLPALVDTTFPPMTDTTVQAVLADDVDDDGSADYLYVQTEYEQTYVVCSPAGPLSDVRTRSHFDFMARNGNYGMVLENATGRLWLFQDRGDHVFYLQ